MTTEASVLPAAAPRRETVGRRYLATVSAQALQFVTSATAAGIVPRALGAAAYGDYSFLLSMAATVRSLTEPSVQQAFFTFSSQDEKSGALTRLYAIWMVAQFFVILAGILLVAVFGWTPRIWPGQTLSHIVLLTSVDWGAFLALSLKQLGDSKGLTIRPQAVGAAAALLSLAGLVGLAWSGTLTFTTFAALNIATTGLTTCFLAYWLLVVQAQRCWEGSVRETARQHVRRWWAYSRPLILVEYYTPLIAALGAYLVQVWDGSVEQGHLALATRWSVVALLFTSSATMIVWREVASAVAAADHARARHVYQRFSGVLVFVAAVLCFWLSLASPTLVAVLAGAQYVDGIPAVMVMAFYPLAQTIGQLSTAGLKAAGQTAEYRKWAVLLSIPDLALTYFLIAPHTAAVPGLGLGALGVALRMAGFGLISVQVYDWSLSRYLGLAYFRRLVRFATTIVMVGGCAIMTMVILRAAIATYLPDGRLLALGIVSVVYFATAGVLLLTVPQCAGVNRQDLRTMAAGLRGRW